MDTTATIYDLIERYGEDEVERWLAGEEGSIADEAGRLDDAEAEALIKFWPFWARPGQRWTPGPETITYYSAGRGFGKTVVLSNIIGEAALEPERWGHEALLIGITPADVRETNIQGPTGIVATCERYGYPRPEVRLSPPYSLTFPHPQGGNRRGLHVRVASSNKPEHARGPNIGLLLADEWAFFADVRDEQGLTTWEAAMHALRVGEERAVIVSSPSRKAAVRDMLRRAEQPECSCGHRLDKSPRRRFSELFTADSTEPVRECPACGETVTAEVRVIRASTLDNRANLKRRFLERVTRDLATGSRSALGEFGGEILDDDSASPIGSIQIHRLDLTTGLDPWLDVRRALGLARVIVQVDPAVTSGEGSADTGVLAVGCRMREGDAPPPIFGLEDWSLPAADVEGSPSRTWAPRAAILAALWRADAIHIETNQGGDEVLSSARSALVALTAADLAPYTSDPVAVSHALHAARAARVEGVTRRASKAARWDWAATYAASGDLSLILSPMLPPGRDSDGRECGHWQTTREHLTRFVPGPGGRSSTRDPIDRGDTLIAAAQVLLGVRERGGGLTMVDPSKSPVYTTGRIF